MIDASGHGQLFLLIGGWLAAAPEPRFFGAVSWPGLITWQPRLQDRAVLPPNSAVHIGA
jgi:hypothetical protein